jgi:drug/metabolite transporter (DMT)-like permease
VALGTGSLVAGAVAIVTAIALVTTPLSALVGLTEKFPTRETAGILAGLGLPAMLLGIVVVLPSSRREGVGVVAGALVCVAGVGLFAHAYPMQWPPAEPSLAFETTMTYFVGAALAFWSVFSALASFHIRNDPQGTVRMELTQQGETRTVQVPREQYDQYRQALRGDGGESDQVVQEIKSKFEE